jgi:hypothetical protein
MEGLEEGRRVEKSSSTFFNSRYIGTYRYMYFILFWDGRKT